MCLPLFFYYNFIDSFPGFHGQRLGTSLDLKPEVSRKSKFEEIYSVSIHYPSSSGLTVCESFVPAGDKRSNVSRKATLQLNIRFPRTTSLTVL